MVIYDTILVRYGELTTKGKNRKDFIRRLAKNIKSLLPKETGIVVESTYDRIYLRLNGEDPSLIIEKLKKVFGIRSFSLTRKIESSIEEIEKTCLEIAKETQQGTFKVVSRRNDKNFEIRSDEINRRVATNILKNTEHKVDVHNPDFKIWIEVREAATYITSKVIFGVGGYPVGVNGKAMLMLSGGIDSPVAAYFIMKRGVMVEAVHFASPPYTSAAAQEKVLELARLTSNYQGNMKVHIVPFTEIQMEIYKNCPESYAITLMRRMMVRIAERLAIKNKCLAIATGESLGQVASQTLESMSCINNVTKMPMLRPIITFDKIEIIDEAKKIGTYETSILPFEDCCTIFNPKNPVTKPLLDKSEKYESKFNYELLIEKAIDGVETKIVFFEEKEEDYL